MAEATDDLAQGAAAAVVQRGMARRHGVDAGARITQRWLAEERDAKANAEMVSLVAKQQREAELARMRDGNPFCDASDDYPPAWDGAW
jgi:hypothetical protein